MSKQGDRWKFRATRRPARQNTLALLEALEPRVMLSTATLPASAVGSSRAPVALDAVAAPMAVVTGNGNPIANGEDVPSTANGTDFGNVAQNTVGFETYTIFNTGTATLNITAPITVTGGFLVGSPATTSIAPGDSTTFSVSIPFLTVMPGVAPAVAPLDTFNGTVTIPTDDPDNNPYAFEVQATEVQSTAPVAAITGNGQPIADGSTTPSTTNATDFGTIPQNGSTSTETYTISNPGTGALSITHISMPAGYTLVAGPAANLPAGLTTTFQVGLLSGTPGTFAGNVSVTTNDPTNNPYTFAITGTVIPPAPVGPIIASLTTNGPVIKGSTLTLTASGVATAAPATIKGVAFLMGTSATFNPTTAKAVGIGKLVDGNYVLSLSTKTLPVGQAFFFAIATDSARQVSSPVEATTTIQDTPPVIKSFSVTPTNPAAGQPLSFKSTGVTDPFNTVTSVTYYWNPTGASTLTGAVQLGQPSTTKGTFALTVPGTQTASFPMSGDITFLAVAMDASNTLSMPVVLTVPVNVPPVVGAVTATPNPVGRTQVATGTVAVTDSNDKIKSVIFYRGAIGDTMFNPADPVLGVGKLKGGVYSFSGAIPAVTPLGTYPIFAVAINTHGATGNIGQTSLTVVDNPPVVKTLTVKPTKVAPDSSATFKVSGAADTDGTVGQVNVYWDPTPGTVIPPGTDLSTTDAVLLGHADAADKWTVTVTLPSTSHTPPFPTSGPITFLAQAVDDLNIAGNFASTKATAVVQPAIAQVSANPSPIDHTQGVTFTASGVSDSDSTIKTVNFWLAPGGSDTLDTVTDTLLGKGVKGSGANATNWVLTLKSLSTITPGNYVLFAQAIDSNGAVSEAVSVNVTVS